MPNVDIETASKHLRDLLISALTPGWKHLVVRIEVDKGTGSVDVYRFKTDNEVVHISDAALTMRLFDWAYELPGKMPDRNQAWSVLVARVKELGDLEIEFLSEDIAEYSKYFERRRAAFHANEFPGCSIEEGAIA